MQFGIYPTAGAEGSPQTYLHGLRKGIVPPSYLFFSTKFEVDEQMNLQWHNKSFVDKKNPNGNRATWCVRFGRRYARLVALKYVDREDKYCQAYQATLKVAYV